MDPATILSLVSASSSLTLKCGTIIKDLYQLAERYKHAEISILSIIDECRTIELAWSRIEQWATHNLQSCDDYEALQDRLQLSLYSGSLVMSELAKDLASVQDAPQISTFRRKTKFVWNQSLFKEHQDRIRGQVCALTLLLEVIQLPSKSDRAELLSIKEPVFRDIDDSVRSVVPSRLSWTGSDTDSLRSPDEGDLWYIPFSFEDALFTSYVYKRNFRIPRVKQLLRKATIKHARSEADSSSAISGYSHDAEDRSLMATSFSATFEESVLDDSSKHYEPLVPMITCHDVAESWCVATTPKRDSFGVLEDSQANMVPHSSQGTFAPSWQDDQAKAHLGQVSKTYPVSIVIRRKPLPNRFLDNTATTQEITSMLRREAETEDSDMNQIDVSLDSHSKSVQVCENREEVGTYNEYEFDDGPAPGITIAWPTEDKSHLDGFDIDLSRQVSVNDHQGAIESIRKGGDIFALFSGSGAKPMPSMVSNTFRYLLENDPVLFQIVMQTTALSHGTRKITAMAELLTKGDCRVMEVEDSAPAQTVTAIDDWIYSISENTTIRSLAAYRDETVSSGIFTSSPTGLQLACVTNNAPIVEYLLRNGYPDLPIHWSHDPFILATKRRCKRILELFLEYASRSVSGTIRNLALLLVVNKDCVTSESWLEREQNDRVRVPIDTEIVDLLLEHGASAVATGKNDVSALSMATASAEYGDIHSARIIDTLTRKGAQFSRVEDYNKIVDFSRRARQDGGSLYRLYSDITGRETTINSARQGRSNKLYPYDGPWSQRRGNTNHASFCHISQKVPPAA